VFDREFIPARGTSHSSWNGPEHLSASAARDLPENLLLYWQSKGANDALPLLHRCNKRQELRRSKLEWRL
jgi:hypothetical protein